MSGKVLSSMYSYVIDTIKSGHLPIFSVLSLLASFLASLPHTYTVFASLSTATSSIFLNQFFFLLNSVSSTSSCIHLPLMSSLLILSICVNTLNLPMGISHVHCIHLIDVRACSVVPNKSNVYLTACTLTILIYTSLPGNGLVISGVYSQYMHIYLIGSRIYAQEVNWLPNCHGQ